VIWYAAGVLAAISLTAFISYAFGRWWLGWRRFRNHLHSIRPSAYAGVPDWWHWGFSFGLWGNFDPGAHFTSTGIALRIGPFVAGAQLDDSN